MTTSKQFFGILLLVFAVSIVVNVTYFLTRGVLSQEWTFAVAFFAVPLLLAGIVYWKGYFGRLGYSRTEEYLFSPYYEVSLRDRIKLIAAIALLGFLPVLVTVLMLPESDAPWIFALPFGIVVFVYVLTVLGYSAILFEPSRSLYRRGLAPMMIIVGGLTAAYGFYASNPLGTWEWSVIAVSYGAVFYGGLLLLQVSRTIADAKSTVESEIAFAGEVQRQFLPSRRVQAGKALAYSTSQPARQLGGDFFHLSPSDDGKLIAAVGDVSGHSFGAGLIMTMLKTSFENFLWFGLSGDALLDNMNQQLLAQTERSLFASFAFVEIDTEEGSGVLWNAGHMPVLFYCGQTASVRELRTPGLALGLSAEAAYVPQSFHMQPGDWLVLFSDGLVETREADGTVRGLEFFADVVQQVLPLSSEPSEVAYEVNTRISEAHQQPFLHDDTTLIVLKFGC